MPHVRRRWRSLLPVTALVASAVLTPMAATADDQPAASTGKVCADAGEGYESATPDSVGLDAAKLRAALDYWTEHGSETVKVFRNNCIVGQGSLDPVYDHKPIWIASHTKTLVMLAVGRAQTLGYLNVDDPIGKYITDVGDDAHRAITIRQLMNMTSGLHMNWSREVEQPGIPDRIHEAMSLKFDFPPGTHMWYQQTPCWFVPEVISKATGMDFQDFLQKELFDPMGIPKSHWFWTRDRAGHSDGPGWKVFEYGLDFGRHGQLLLNDGKFRGKQLIDPEFLRQAKTGTAANPAYGFFMWLNSADHWVNGSLFKREEHDSPGLIVSAPRDMYMSWGYRGQHVFVIPSLNMVVTRTGETTPDQWGEAPGQDPGYAMTMGEQKAGYYTFFKMLMEAVTDRQMPAPPPFETQKTLPLDDIDMNDIVSPTEDNPASMSSGPAAPKGCTLAGCGGQVAYEGTRTWMTDSVRTVPGSVTGLSEAPRSMSSETARLKN